MLSPTEYVLSGGILPPSLGGDLNPKHLHTSFHNPNGGDPAVKCLDSASKIDGSFTEAMVPFTIPWARPVPSPMHASVPELFWLYPDFHTGLVWDSTIGQDDQTEAKEKTIIQELILRALKGPLLPAQQQKVR